VKKKITIIEFIIVIVLIVIIMAVLDYRRFFYCTPVSYQLPLDSSEPYIFVSTWGNEGEDEGQFKRPDGIALDDMSNVYVADFETNYIQKFDSAGKFITRWMVKGKKNGQLNSVGKIAVSKRNIYVCDIENGGIQKYNLNGKFITEWETGYLCDVTVDREGYIYVLGYSGITKYNPDTTEEEVIKHWNFKFDPDTIDDIPIIHCEYFSSIVVDLPILYVVWHSVPINCIYDTNKPVDERDYGSYFNKFNLNNDEFIINLVNPGKEAMFINSRNITMGNYGPIFILETSKNCILVLSSEGNIITEFGSKGSGDGQFRGPIDAAVDSKGNIYVIDAGNCRIQKFAPNRKNKANN